MILGNACDAQNFDRLKEHGITHILNCTPDLSCFWGDKYTYMRMEILDLPSQNIRKHFDQAIEFIGKCSFSLFIPSHILFIIDDALRSNGNVLVHCSAGISRSPTLVLAYMMKKNCWTLEEAFDKMRQLRCIVDPNVSFIVQLKEWEKYVRTPSTNPSEIIDEHSGTTNPSRTNSTTYCGSSSKSKSDSKSHTDAPIIVN